MKILSDGQKLQIFIGALAYCGYKNLYLEQVSVFCQVSANLKTQKPPEVKMKTMRILSVFVLTVLLSACRIGGGYMPLPYVEVGVGDSSGSPTSEAESGNLAQAEDGGAVVTDAQSNQTMGQWKVQYFTGATTLMKNFRFTDYVSGWKEFPNVDWPAGSFLAKNGLEYGQELSDFCQQDQTCDFPIAARSYRVITADYNIDGIGECHENGTGIGCALIIVDMGDVSASFRGQMADTGHTITGLYWNGDEVDQAVSAWASHVVYRMVGVPGNNPANPGANCSVPGGCEGVDITFAITSGNELLVLGHAVVNPR